MARHFPDFLTAYCEYANSQYAPDKFTLWTGVSLIAGALERKVWLPEDGFPNYPNLFVLLVGGPGVGKSSAIRRGLPLLREIQKSNHMFKIVEGITTAAGLRETMSITDTMPGGDCNPFSSAYLVGSEGSDSALKNHGDDFRSMVCAMYDCNDLYELTLKEKHCLIPQPVVNLLVGATFDFLGSVIDQNTVFGGLASRFTYVIEKESELTGDFFGQVAIEGEETEVNIEGDPEMKKKLADDLFKIHRTYGPLRIKRDVIPLVNNWYREFKDMFNGLESERIKALTIRQRTLLKKLMIILAMSSDSSTITPEHAGRAIDMTREVTKDNPYILSRSATVNLDDQRGTTILLLRALAQRGGKLPKKVLFSLALGNGNDVDRITKTFDYLLGINWVRLDTQTGIVELLVDPDRYL